MTDWERAVAAEPALTQLLTDIQAVGSCERFCANALWYGYPGHGDGFKRRLLALVGWERDEPASDGWIYSHEAYEACYETCYDALPDCDHAGHGC